MAFGSRELVGPAAHMRTQSEGPIIGSGVSLYNIGSTCKNGRRAIDSTKQRAPQNLLFGLGDRITMQVSREQVRSARSIKL